MKRGLVTCWRARSGLPAMPVWPDGCRDLVVRLEPGKPPQAFSTGLEASARTVAATPGTQYFGIRFAAGVGFSWDATSPRMPAVDLELAALSGPYGEWYRRLYRYPERAECLLLEAVARWVTPQPAGVREFFESLEIGAEEEWAQPLTSCRTLRRHVRNATGAPPIFWRRLRRARCAGLEVAVGSTPLVDIAARFGYSDQSHLTRDMRTWFGVTPSALRRNPGLARSLLTAPDTFSPLKPA
ncbi:hypothetical protein CAI21_02985 [Alkalilimnicola ehrlichii]|uniref:HTH araC/xylS-type domain-containing protein n=1 Tax=Alkalilimnicola ehrlichii TaxID=351052 RepID=A0A3E0X0W3_9GAMM|nr:helix-turn-helix domain-containing protein [Alkalilimnicola ehrlichii]RFA30957.1 hypothetical protein CAI21_02985 [Alkalilimnicola ehrlichii]RFA38908.1 hypothetical protein CAL65_03130 [Alkalilimnicola ehrlichii]